MKLHDYAETLGTQVNYGVDVNDRVFVNLRDLDIKDGPILKSPSGRGETPKIARQRYIEEMTGQNVVLNPLGDGRREFTFPDGITADR